MIKGVLFDFDGVLTTEETGTMSIAKYICKETNIDYDLFKSEYLKYNKILNYTETRHEEIWNELCVKLNQNINIDILYNAFINTPINPEIIDLIKKLKGKGYKIGMITDNKKDRTDMIVNHHRLDKIFDVITVSASVGLGKDTNKIFELTLGKLMLNANECIFIDNQEKNLIAPKNIGINAIYYNHDERDVDKLIKNLEALGVKI